MTPDPHPVERSPEPTAESAAETLSPTKRALLALKQLQAKLDAVERDRTEPIAIIGMGCRFPGGADHPQAFWQLLQRREDAITEVPGDRWPLEQYYSPDPSAAGKMHTRHAGLVPHLWEFDAPFFRIAPREALSLDPQQRLLLELAWEALENAGLPPDSLNGSPTGVFVGICSIDYWQQLLNRRAETIDAYLTTGNTHSMASGRLSYTLGLTGPSLSIDTACSSSLVSVHLACQSLRQRECDLALAGGVNRILSPEVSINFSKARMLSPQGRCKAFDAEADGFVRAEGGGLIVLKRLRDAIAAGDSIRAVILGSAVNHDGRSNGLTAPNGVAQQRVIRQALDAAGIDPAQLGYIEAHGTGTALGDPIEMGALGAVFNGSRPGDRPLLIGSVKTNIGHLEAAAGIAGLIKTVLAVQHGQIPANLHFHVPNPHIAWADLAVKVPTQTMPWSASGSPDGDQRRAGISAFGFNGTNAHVIIAEPPSPPLPTLPPPTLPTNPTDSSATCYLFTLSAKTERALKQLAERYQQHLTAHPELAIADICFTASHGRSHFNHRLAVVTTSTVELQRSLQTWLNGQTLPTISCGRAQPGESSLPMNAGALTPEDLAQRYIQGCPIDESWPVTGEVAGEMAGKMGDRPRKVELPTYPFQRDRIAL